jgi:acyl-CoA reductase-like NAD-dependent aldehyde dehydrogenase
MLESRKAQFVEELIAQGSTKASAEKEVHLTIDRIVYYAGWCDKYQQVVSSVNPVASSHFNFSVAEPMGVIGIHAPQDSSLIGLVSLVIPALAGGNTVVAIASEQLPLCAITFAEVLNSSDVPGGVVNILTGKQDELKSTLVAHMDVNAVVYGGNDKIMIAAIEKEATINLKRTFHYDQNWMLANGQYLHFITDLQEIKTTWHPIEHIGGATSSY